MLRQKSFFGILRSSPLLVSLAAAGVVVFLLGFIGYARRGGFWAPEVEARVFVNRGEHRRSVAGNGERMFAFQGEVFSDAERLREGAAIAASGMLLAAQQKLAARAFPSVESLLAAISTNELLPPGVVLDQGGKSLSSQHAVYYVRFRGAPLGVEVVSMCKGELCGPSLLVRLPDDEFSQDALTYYVAPRVGQSVAVPGAFVAPAEIIREGWTPVTFRAAAVAEDEIRKGKQWLAGK